MSHIVVFLVFGVLNTKYLVFGTTNASTLILGWLRFFIFDLMFCFCVVYLLVGLGKLKGRGSKFLEEEGVRDWKIRPLKKERFGCFEGHLSFWVSSMESPLIFYTKINK